MSVHPSWTDAALRETIERLAAPAETQLAFLRELGTYPMLDELALEFDDEYRRVRSPDGPDRETRSAQAAAALAALDAKLDSMSGASQTSISGAHPRSMTATGQKPADSLVVALDALQPAP